MSMQCKVSNKLTPLELCSMILEEEEAEEDIEAKVKDWSYAITVDNKVTMHGTARRLSATIVKPLII